MSLTKILLVREKMLPLLNSFLNLKLVHTNNDLQAKNPL